MMPRHRLVLTALLSLLAAGPVAAQPAPVPSSAAGAPSAQAPARTRAEALATEQARKALQVVPERRGVVEETVVRLMSSPLLSGSGGLYPWFGSVFGGSGFALGTGYLRRLPRGGRSNALAGISVNGSTLLEATLSTPTLFSGRVEPRLVFRRQDVNDVAFYGLGQQSDETQRIGYTFIPTTLGAAAALRPARFVELTAGYEWLDIGTRVEESPAPGVDAEAAPGLGEAVSYDVFRSGLAVDTRPATGYATRGTLARVGYARHDPRSGGRYGFDEVEVEAAQLVPLLREQYVLAFRALATFTSVEADNRVPVPLMPFLGSGSTLRGFANRRFYDTNRIVLTGEYRWRPSRYLDMAVFLDAGQVGPEPDRFRLSDFDTSAGLGMRFHGPAFSVLRVEIARSRERWNLVVGASQPF